MIIICYISNFQIKFFFYKYYSIKWYINEYCSYVYTIPHLYSLIFLTVLKTLKFYFLFISIIMIKMLINTPLLPTPALQCTTKLLCENILSIIKSIVLFDNSTIEWSIHPNH